MSCARHVCGSATSAGGLAFEAAIIAAVIRRRGTWDRVDVNIGEKRLGRVVFLGSSHEVAVHRFILRPAVKLAIAVGTNNDCWFVTVGIGVFVAASAADTTLHAIITNVTS
jgi:hypothetical protein